MGKLHLIDSLLVVLVEDMIDTIELKIITKRQIGWRIQLRRDGRIEQQMIGRQTFGGHSSLVGRGRTNQIIVDERQETGVAIVSSMAQLVSPNLLLLDKNKIRKQQQPQNAKHLLFSSRAILVVEQRKAQLEILRTNGTQFVL